MIQFDFCIFFKWVGKNHQPEKCEDIGITNVLVFVGPGMDSLGPGMDSLGPGMDSLGPGMDSLGPGMDSLGPGINSFGPGMDSFLHCLWFGRHHGALVWGDGPNGGEARHLTRLLIV